jgi:hypothetical protein
VFADSKLAGVRYHNDHLLEVVVPSASSSLTLMVENLGRLNFFGPSVKNQRKGMDGPIRLNLFSKLQNWTAHSVALAASETANLQWQVRVLTADWWRND